MHRSRKIARSSRNCCINAALCLLLLLPGCGSPNDPNLFSHEGVHSASGGVSAGSGASGVSGASSAGSTGGALGSFGTADLAGTGGQVSALKAGAPGAGYGGASSEAGGPNLSSPCLSHGADASYFDQTQHCYSVIRELRTFADAQAHCVALGAHLVTLASDAENHFVSTLSPDERWIGATDGKGPREPQPGNYTWLTGEPFDFQKWSGGQPNASRTDCDGKGGAECFEHCAFLAGEVWNDRYCLHSIQSTCEWDSTQS